MKICITVIFWASLVPLIVSCQKKDTLVSGAIDFNLSNEEINKYKILASSGNTEAANRLFRYYNIVALNYPEAIKWLTVAAENGDPLSQYNLGNLYSVPPLSDNKVAIFWLEKSKLNGFPDAAKVLKRIREKEMNVHTNR